MKFTLRRKFAVLALFIGLVSIIGTTSTFYLAKDSIISEELENIEKELEFLGVKTSRSLDAFSHDLEVLSRTTTLKTLVDATLDNQAQYNDSREKLADLFIAFSESQPWYMQIRYIDESGQEVVRVDRKKKMDSIQVIPDDELQDKSNREYFQETIMMAEGKIFVTELDLNIEHGEIEVPYRPTIRYAMPVFDSNGEKGGIIIINVLVENLLAEIRSFNKDVFLTDEEGYYLINPYAPEEEWGKYLGTEYKNYDFLEHQSELSFQSAGENSYSVLEEKFGHVDIFQKIDYNENNPEKYFVLSERVSLEDLYAGFDIFQRNMITVNSITFIVFVLIFIVFVSRITKPIQSLTSAVSEIEKGNYDITVTSGTEDELGKLAKIFNNFTKAIREQEKEKYEFITSASHQLRTPSSGINVQIAVLKEKLEKIPEGEHLIKDLASITENNDKSVMIMNDLFKILEIGEKYYGSHLSNVKLTDLTSLVLSSYDQLIKKNKYKVNVNIPEDLEINVDEGFFRCALDNLIKNAIDYSNEGGEINIMAEKRENVVYFEVSDEGIGIPANEQTHVFNKFFRAKNSYLKKVVGTGLGLVIAEKVIEGHRGKINFKSVENQGTTFYFSLPI